MSPKPQSAKPQSAKPQSAKPQSSSLEPTLTARLLAEFVGTAFLLIAVVGSGIMAAQLSDDVGLQLLENSIATACALVALILAFGGVSGAHFNPAVTLAERALGGIDNRMTGLYIVAQTAGGILGTIVANLMFDLSAVQWSTRDRSATELVFADSVATLGLLLIIFGVVRSGPPSTVAFAVGGYIGGAYWFTSSTSFANPAVTIARMFSDTFAGIAPASAPGFIAAQLVATGLAVVLIRIIFPDVPRADTYGLTGNGDDQHDDCGDGDDGGVHQHRSID